jgi:hypothetical protein
MIYGWMLTLVVVGVTGLAFPQLASVLKPVAIAIGVAGAAVFAFIMVPKRLTVEVRGREVVIGERTFPIDGATIGVCLLPMYGVSFGTALILSDGGRRFTLAGRDVRPPVDGPHVQATDAYLEAADFDALLALLAVPRWFDAPGRCLLAGSNVSFGSQKPTMALEIQGTTLQVIDLASQRPLASAPVNAVGVQLATHVSTGRVSLRFPVLALTVPGLEQPLTITIPDFRYSWRDDGPRSKQARYVCGGPDWLLLIRTFALEPSLQIGNG